MTHARLPLAALAALATALPLSAQDEPAKHLLRYAFQKGASGHYELAQKVDMDMNMGGRSMATAMTMKMSLEFKVADVKDGLAHIEHTIHRVRAKMDNPMTGSIDLDTDDEDSVPAMFDSFLDMVGQTMKLRVDDRGKSHGVTIPESLKQMAARGTGIDFDQMFEQFMALFPEEPIAIGDTWQTSMKQKLGQLGAAEVEVENRLVALQGSKATIDMTMKMDLETDAMPMKVDLTDARGKVVMNLREGLPEQMTMDMKMSMKADHGAGQMDMQMKMGMELGRVAAPKPGPEKKKD